MQFRHENGQLWTADYVQWLLFLRQRGIARLVLLSNEELLEYVPLAEPPRSLGSILCISDEGAEVWVRQKEPVLFEAINTTYPNNAHWAAPIETYWQRPLPQSPRPVEVVDWNVFRTQCLEQVMNMPIAEVREIGQCWQSQPCKPYIGPFSGCAEWQALPLTPYNLTSEYGHMLLQLLERLDGWYTNFTHGKNDGSPFWSFSEEEQNALGEWHDKVQYWQQRCLLSLANQEVDVFTSLPAWQQGWAVLPITDSHANIMPSTKRTVVRTAFYFMAALIFVIGLCTGLFYLFANYFWPTSAIVAFVLLIDNWKQKKAVTRNKP
ncbi:hypothetical protein [Pseudogulbenkiania subflava]|nr:hypothetical protein [Pseudogulbenkiania subflava]